MVTAPDSTCDRVAPLNISCRNSPGVKTAALALNDRQNTELLRNLGKKPLRSRLNGGRRYCIGSFCCFGSVLRPSSEARGLFYAVRNLTSLARGLITAIQLYRMRWSGNNLNAFTFSEFGHRINLDQFVASADLDAWGIVVP